jgi:diguanylate cyclase (GGDEF)-like protein
VETLDYEETTEDLKKRIYGLNSMIDIGKNLSSDLKLGGLLTAIILACGGQFQSSDAIILLYKEKEENPGFYDAIDEKEVKINFPEKFIGFVNKTREVFENDKLKNVPELKAAYDIFKKMEVELVVPLHCKGKVNGILCLKKKEEGFGSKYSEDEKELMAIMAGFASVAIENARLFKRATHDIKTGLYNHGYFQNRLLEEIDRSNRFQTDLRVMIIDLDHFKSINDTYGHIVGDEVLIKVAHTVRQHIRGFDIPARFGGEEFTIILPETSSKDAINVAERLRKNIADCRFSAPRNNNGKAVSFKVTASIGVASYVLESSEMTDDILIDNADQALYYAKEHGRNQSVIFDNISEGS